MALENYIIRIYRHEKENPRKIVGTVEEVGQDGKKAFTSYDELWDILNAPAKRDILADSEAERPMRQRKP